MRTLEEARALDAADPLRGLRDAFDLPDGEIYLDGNSLGALPRATIARMTETIRGEWGRDLIRSWNKAGWIEAPARVGGKIAQLIGAKPHEVLVADSTSVNLYKLLAAAVKARPGRRVILSEPGNFPTDLYVAQGVAEALDVELRLAPREAIVDALDEDVAVLLLTHVHYRSAVTFDMAAVTRAAQEKGALVLWDLSHSAGAVAVDLNAANADLAAGCGYKYLNGGPGAPAFLFVAERHQAMLRSPLSGWMGHAAPFDFDDDYAPGEGIARFLCGTPPILGIAALEEGVDMLLGTDREALYAKGQALCSAFIDLVEHRCAGLGVTLATPRDPSLRGSHVSFRHDHGWPIMQALIARGVIGDFRAPDILRFGFTPLYVGFEDLWRAVDILRDILATEAWDEPAFRARAAVT
ncbi:kynureninase [Sphingomonas sp. CGMCC 1.13654]|uniref:Kynureninase n=1 Tax=Sphingomonas chungangi TaxID=2683589 RepID=A0A838L1D7_9SPHN|nr:kynureninase [Sphingomonas chungangi]MVW57843.1 kynureninase [Sphingomonas chungangi]